MWQMFVLLGQYYTVINLIIRTPYLFLEKNTKLIYIL